MLPTDAHVWKQILRKFSKRSHVSIWLEFFKYYTKMAHYTIKTVQQSFFRQKNDFHCLNAKLFLGVYGRCLTPNPFAWTVNKFAQHISNFGWHWFDAKIIQRKQVLCSNIDSKLFFLNVLIIFAYSASVLQIILLQFCQKIPKK